MLFFKSKQRRMKESAEKKNKDDIKNICQNLLQIIGEGGVFTEVPAKRVADLIEIGSVTYDENFWDLLIQLHKKLGEDFNYTTNMNKEGIKEKEIKTLNLKQISTYLTFIIRGEKFAEGHIAVHLKNGVLKNLILRAIELC